MEMEETEGNKSDLPESNEFMEEIRVLKERNEKLTEEFQNSKIETVNYRIFYIILQYLYS